MIISVVGAGAIGSAVARDLALREGVTEVRVCDARSRALQSLGELVSSSKLRPFQVEGRDATVLAPIIEGSSCVVGAADPTLNLSLARLCLNIGSHFCDPGGFDTVTESILELGDAARDKGLWLIPNCGLAPGLANVLCMLGIEHFDTVEHAHIRVGDITLNPEPPFDFRVSTSPQKMVEDYTNTSFAIRDGALVEVEPLADVEHIFFEEPYGLLEAFNTAVSGGTMIRTFADRVRNLDVKTIKRPGHADQWRFLVSLGFAERRSIDLRTHLTYRDVLLRRLRSLLGDDQPDVVLLRVLVCGERAGERKTIAYELIQSSAEDDGIGAVRAATSIPTAIVAETLGAGEIAGGGSGVPEVVLDKEQFVQRLAQRGMVVKARELDGWLDLSDPQYAAKVG